MTWLIAGGAILLLLGGGIYWIYRVGRKTQASDYIEAQRKAEAIRAEEILHYLEKKNALNHEGKIIHKKVHEAFINGAHVDTIARLLHCAREGCDEDPAPKEPDST